MPFIRPTTKGELYWWKDVTPKEIDLTRTDMYVMEAFYSSKKVPFGPSKPMTYRLIFSIDTKDRRGIMVRMTYTQGGRYSSGTKPVVLLWSFGSKKEASKWYSKIKRRVSSATTFNALMNKIGILKADAKKYTGKKRG